MLPELTGEEGFQYNVLIFNPKIIFLGAFVNKKKNNLYDVKHYILLLF